MVKVTKFRQKDFFVWSVWSNPLSMYISDSTYSPFYLWNNITHTFSWYSKYSRVWNWLNWDQLGLLSGGKQRCRDPEHITSQTVGVYISPPKKLLYPLNNLKLNDINVTRPSGTRVLEKGKKTLGFHRFLIICCHVNMFL